jgi:hypothetical protein
MRTVKTDLATTRQAHHMTVKVLFVLALVLGLSATPATAADAELILFELEGCPVCAVWNLEVGPIYPKTPEGKRAPLRRVEIEGPRPADLRHIEGVKYSPTFVLLHQGDEVARVTGYKGEDFFWGFITKYVGQMPSVGDQEPKTP